MEKLPNDLLGKRHRDDAVSNEMKDCKENIISHHIIATYERLDWSWKDISKDWREMEEKGLESIEPDNLYQMRINLHPFFYLSTLSSKKQMCL